MPVVLRIALIVSATVMFCYIIRKVRKNKVQIEHTVFWIIISIALVIISLAPQIVYFFADLLQIQSPANLILSFIIFLLIIKQFLMTIEISQLEAKMKELVEELALKEQEEKKRNARETKKEAD